MSNTLRQNANQIISASISVGRCIKHLKSLVVHLKSWYTLYETVFWINAFLFSDV